MQHYEPDEKMNWPVAPDLAEEYDVLFTIDEDELPEIQPHFDPVAFVTTNPKPEAAAWKLSDEKLRQLSLNVTRIRKQINEKAAGQRQDEEIPLGDGRKCDDDQDQPHVQVVIKRTSKNSNPNGLLEKERKAQERAVRYPGRKYKKRRHAELSSGEITDIVHSYLVEHLSQ